MLLRRADQRLLSHYPIADAILSAIDCNLVHRNPAITEVQWKSLGGSLDVGPGIVAICQGKTFLEQQRSDAFTVVSRSDNENVQDW